MTAHGTMVISVAGNAICRPEVVEHVNQIVKWSQLPFATHSSISMETKRMGKRMGKLLSFTTPWLGKNIAAFLAIYLADMDNPRFMGYLLIQAGRPASFTGDQFYGSGWTLKYSRIWEN